MDTSLDARARLIFDEAIDLRDEDRSSVIARACGDDVALRQRVEALIAAAEKQDGFLGDPTLGSGSLSGDGRSAEQPGTLIGPYRLLERIGEGGFGAVFMAEQSSPVRRRVALKIVKLGMDTRMVIARFEQERQALALMDHPNIARVFDAGATDTGRPYFVMELVRGAPITTYCDREQLSIPQRVELFTQVCRAVQHAHTKGVIHRDIKPGNVLVGTVDGRPLAKIIDFGIAKAIQDRLTDKTLFTEFRQLVGTPEYMSPEQAAGSLDIDTRTDVYALGVLLYELLTGSTPFDAKQLRSAAYAEMQRIIREVDPPAPSTRLANSREGALAIAALRGTLPHRLGSTVRGELDWIVMRTLDKERARRYDSAGDLAADIERYLEGKPVEAAPPSRAYRFRKMLRRHRLGVGVGAIVAVALVAGTGVALWQARVAARERDAATISAIAAETARREADQVAEFESARLKDIDAAGMGKRLLADLAENAREGMARAGVAEGRITERLAQLEDLLADVNATSLALRTLDANIFEGALRAVDEQFKDQPAVQARLLQILADTLQGLGLIDRASGPMERAVEIRRRVLGDRHSDTLLSIDNLGSLRVAQSRLGDAEACTREALGAREAMLGPDHPETLNSLNNLGMIFLMQGKMKDAEACLRDLLEKDRRIKGPDHPDTLQVVNNMGGMLLETGRPAEAESFFRESLVARRRVSGVDHFQTIVSTSNLALSIEKQGRPADAEPLYQDALARAKRMLGEEHPQTLLFKSNLGFLLCTLGRLPEAESLTLEALTTRRRLFGNAHGDTLQSIHNFAVLLVAQGDVAGAEAHFQEALKGRLAALGGAHRYVTQTRTSLASLLADQGRHAEAEAILLEAHRNAAESKDINRKQLAARIEALIAFYEAWDKAKPEKGHADKAARWRQALADLPGDPAPVVPGAAPPRP